MDADIEALLAALQATPHNAVLRQLLVDRCLDAGDAATLRRVLEVVGGEDLDGWARRDEIDALLAGNNAQPAVADLLGDARRLLAAGDRHGALDAYRAAMEANPAAEDTLLRDQIMGKVVSLHDARQGRAVTSIANDRETLGDLSAVLRPSGGTVRFADVGGLDDVKEQIRRRIITPFLKPSLFQRFKRKAGGGILMYGPPGCGKTLLARATAGECNARFYNVAISDVLDMYIGESERKLHELFEQARRTAPSVLFFDEVEAIGGRRQHAREATSTKLVSQFLTELDGFAENNHGVLVLGATNVPWAVDPAFRRPGRFDRLFLVPPPDEAARRQILDLQLRDRPTTPEVDTTRLACMTSGFSGADLRSLVETAVDEAIEDTMSRGAEVPVGPDHLARALKQTRSTTLEWLTTARNHARYSNQGGQYDDVLRFLERHGSR